MIHKPLDRWLDPEAYYAVKGYGRLVLLLAIFIYGIGLVLKRIAAERDAAEGNC